MRTNDTLKILLLAAEAVPFAKTGGLADMAGSLPKAIKALGHDIRVAMPRYGRISVEKFGLEEVLSPFPVPMDDTTEPARIMQTTIALIAGVTLSIPGNWYLSKHGLNLTGLTGDVAVAGINFLAIMRSSVSVNTYVGPIITMLCIVSISVLYPAVKAAVIKPVAAIYHR